MRLHRYLKQDMIDLAFDPLAAPATTAEDPRFASAPAEEEDEGGGEDEEPTRRELWDQKVRILEGLVGLLDRSGRVTNPRKCLVDLRNREAKASTALGRGIAIPHVRTPQAKGFVLAVAVAPEPGLWFDAIDEEPVRLFLPMIAPSHDDRYYLKVERALAAAFADEDDPLRDQLLEAASPGEVIKLLADRLD